MNISVPMGFQRATVCGFKFSCAGHVAAALLAFLASRPARAQNTFPASGSVGIGTTSPTATLEVEAPTSSSGNGNPVGFFDRAYGNPGDSATGIRMDLNNEAGGLYLTGYSGEAYLSRNVEWISGTGNVARGTAAEQIHLCNGIYFNIDSGLTVGSAYAPTTKVFIDEIGRVGIGTTGPSRKLELVGTGSYEPVIRLNRGANTDNALLLLSTNNADDWVLGERGLSDNNLHVFSFGTSADVLTVLRSNGNVGIGTVTPAYPLSVNGAIQAKEVIVQSGWSDYVFDKSYRLQPLSEVEKAIETQHHLPGIPSAKQVATKGISLGDMQARLLAKIEELTLHQIEQEKRLNTAYDRIERLEAENARLRSAANTPFP